MNIQRFRTYGTVGIGHPKNFTILWKRMFRVFRKFHPDYLPVDKNYFEQATEQATEQVKNLIFVIQSEHDRKELMNLLNISHREYFREKYINEALNSGLIELTIPNKPKSSKQKYRLSAKGKRLKEKLKGK